MAGVPSIRKFDRFTRTIAAATISVAAAVGVPAIIATPAAQAAPAPSLPAEFDLGRYTPVNPDKFRSLNYSNNGRAFFTTGRWMCQIGPQYRYVGCKGSPATAPADTQFEKTLGAVISGDQVGPSWARTGLLYEPSYRFGTTSGFRAPLLRPGQRVTIAGVTCTVPRADEVACRTGDRALIFTPGWHKFYYPSNDASSHSGNPSSKYLPARLRGSSQLPAVPAAPR